MILGVVGEGIHDLTAWFKSTFWGPTGGRISVLILVVGLAVEGIAQVNANNATAQIIAALSNETANSRLKTAQLEKELQTEKTQIAARPWTKTQFDALQKLKGVVAGVGVVAEPGCIECHMFATDIEIALNLAGVQLYEDLGNTEPIMSSSTGLSVLLPLNADLNKDPLVDALREAGLSPVVSHHLPNVSKIRTDIPVIYINSRWPPYLSAPYFPQISTQWKVLPLRKSE